MVKPLINAEDELTEEELRIADQCRGASWTGGCPRSGPGAPIRCAGRKIIVTVASEIAKLVLMVEPDAASCPLAAFNMFREGSVVGQMEPA